MVVSRFQDAIVVVTGASRGLGRAIACAFAAEGAHVYVGYRARQREAEQTLAAISQVDGRGSLLQLDVRDADAVHRAMHEVAAKHGRIDVLINNAGIMQQGLFALGKASEDSDLIAVNLGGVMHGCRAVVRAMMRQGSGNIVNVASLAGLRPRAGLTGYAASKAGVIAFTKGLAAELAPKGIRVNAVVPGYIASGMGARVSKPIKEARVGAIPMGRFGEDVELARAVTFLASADASYITGHALVVDGGLGL